jgi:hypothetical protein
MKKITFFSIAALTAVLMFTQIPSAEARGCRSTRVSVNVGNAFAGPTMVRRVARPVMVAPVFTPPPSYYYNPYTACYTPVYAAPAPVYMAAPVYVEEVYVAPRPSLFTGLSFSWNLFR